ncbi:copper amine oxidase N-terminal domain-containing protein [Paenibacillus sp. J31TS4]|uniref:copper amine oxidase N-terminal domain-containing protein n=1 Tax=Paenibacillus sp. J31TS4 TaxID=2807195 RepID=UPI001BCFB75A|nr:copper amine oxidase N-terminal domain-containing protein [Paenibacillus sp. J31TS4]
MKKWVIGGAVLVSTVFGSAVLADSALKLVVNGSLLGEQAKVQLQDGTTMVSARSLAEALGAKVEWENETRTVRIDLPDASLQKGQISLLEKAVAPATAKAAAETWAEGVKTRNGALQYAVMSKELRDKERENFEAFHWVTGTSSPWVDSYKVGEGRENKDGTLTFAVELVYTDSTKAVSTSTQEVTVAKQDDRWYVSELPGSPSDPGVDEFPYDHVTYENQYWAYTVTLPKSWYGQFLAQESETKSELLFQSSTGLKAPIVTIHSVPAADWKQDEYGQLHKLGEKKGRVYYYVLPLDNPYEGREVDAYGRMVQEAKEAMKTFQLP